MTTFVHDDGGRASAGFRGTTGDCVTRAIAIATGLPYREVYDELHRRLKAPRRKTRRNNSRSPRDGVPIRITREYLADLGWSWTPTMFVGQGTKVHVRADELPDGRLILNLSRHLAAVIDGVVHDTGDPSRGGTRCVYGYWRKD